MIPPNGVTASSLPGPPQCRGFKITLRHTTLDRTPLGKLSARRRNLYLSTHNSYKRQTSMRMPGFEPAIAASERPQAHALARPLGSAKTRFSQSYSLKAAMPTTPLTTVAGEFTHTATNGVLLRTRLTQWIHERDKQGAVCSHSMLWKWLFISPSKTVSLVGA